MISEQVQELLVRARNAFRIHDYDTAKTLVQQMLDEYPDSVTATILMGIIAGRTGEPANAIRAFKRALELDKRSAEAYNNLAVILRQQSRLKDALTAVRQAEKLDSRRPDILYNKANILKDLGKTNDAIRTYRKALEADERFVLAYNNLGTLYQAGGDIARAIETFNRGLAIDPNHPTLRYNLGLAFEAQGALEEAERSYQRSLKSRPGWGEALNNLGIVYQKQERYDEAEKSFRNVLAVSHDNPRANNNLATNYALQGRTREAMQYYRQALESDPSYAKAAGNLGQLLDTQSDMEDAVEELQQLAELDTGNLDLQLRLARSLVRSGRSQAAEKVLLRLLEQDSRHLEATRLLADAYFRSGKDERANECYARIAELNADYAEHILDRAVVYRLRQQTVQGLAEVEKYLERKPGDLDALLLKAQLQVDQGREADALQMLVELRNLYPGDGRILAAIASAHQHGGEREEAIRAVDELINLQGSRANPEDIAALNESLELYEQAVDAFADEHKVQWEHNLARLGELSRTDATEEEKELAVEEVEGLDEDSIPILSFGGEELLEPDEWEVKVEEEEIPEEDYLGVEPPQAMAPSLTTLPDEEFRRGVEPAAGGIAPAMGRPGTEQGSSAAPAPAGQPPAPGPAQPPQAWPAPQQPAASPQPAPPPQAPPPYPTYPSYPTYPPYPPPVYPPPPRQEPAAEDEFETPIEELIAEEAEPELEELEPDETGTEEPEDLEELPEEGMVLEPDEDELEPEPELEAEPEEPEEEVPGPPPSPPPHLPRIPEPSRPSPGPRADPGDREQEDHGSAELLGYLSGLAQSLPEKKRAEYMNSEARLKLEYLRSRLAGKPGLKHDVERFAPPAPPAVALTLKRLTDTLTYIGRMSGYHPDAAIGSALKGRVATVLQRVRQLKEGSM